MTFEKIYNYIDQLSTELKNKEILKGIFLGLERLGFNPEEERIRIVLSSLQYLGYSYQMNEELVDSRYIDCSTLTSQSFWEGAMIGIPFTADAQRSAVDGMPVQTDNISPADIVIKYNNIEDAPDKKHNHVGLVIGHYNNDLYVIESNSKEGCVISSLEKFNQKGGVIRYVKNENVIINDAVYNTLNANSKLIPKLSRFGAKQYSNNGNDRILHKGIDIYVAINTQIISPIDGSIEKFTLENDNLPSVKIVNNDLTVIIGNIKVIENLLYVSKGQEIGVVTDESHRSNIIYPSLKDLSHIHLEVKTNKPLPYWANMIEDNGVYNYNGLYTIKMGTILNPIKA